MGETQNFLYTWKNVSRLGETQNFFIDLEKCLEGLVKLVMASYRLGEMSGGFDETSYDQL